MNYTKLFEQIEEDEGRQCKAYKDTKGIWTIGVGRNLESTGLSKQECIEIFGEVIPKSYYIIRLKVKRLTNSQINTLLEADVDRAEEGCYSLVEMNRLNDARKAVLINMAFQMGISGLSRFTKTLEYISRGLYEEASDEMLDSKWFREDTPARAQKMSEQFYSGEWQ